MDSSYIAENPLWWALDGVRWLLAISETGTRSFEKNAAIHQSERILSPVLGCVP